MPTPAARNGSPTRIVCVRAAQPLQPADPWSPAVGPGITQPPPARVPMHRVPPRIAPRVREPPLARLIRPRVLTRQTGRQQIIPQLHAPLPMLPVLIVTPPMRVPIVTLPKLPELHGPHQIILPLLIGLPQARLLLTVLLQILLTVPLLVPHPQTVAPRGPHHRQRAPRAVRRADDHRSRPDLPWRRGPLRGSRRRRARRPGRDGPAARRPRCPPAARRDMDGRAVPSRTRRGRRRIDPGTTAIAAYRHLGVRPQQRRRGRLRGLPLRGPRAASKPDSSLRSVR